MPEEVCVGFECRPSTETDQLSRNREDGRKKTMGMMKLTVAQATEARCELDLDTGREEKP